MLVRFCDLFRKLGGKIFSGQGDVCEQDDPLAVLREAERPKTEERPTMQVSELILDSIRKKEGLELEAYPDPGSPLGRECTKRNLFMRSYRKVPGWEQLSGSPWTIGYGQTGPTIKQGMKITQEQAEEMLLATAEEFSRQVRNLVRVPVNDNQFSALVSLTYNIGIGNLAKSSVLRELNAGNYQKAADHFLDWHTGNGVAGMLTPRRKEERALFLS